MPDPWAVCSRSRTTRGRTASSPTSCGSRSWAARAESSRHVAPSLPRLLSSLRGGDAGATWTTLDGGLPHRDAYLTILRQAFDAEAEGAGLGLYFGSTSGEVFGSGDGGASWFTVHDRLAKVHSVRVA